MSQDRIPQLSGFAEADIAAAFHTLAVEVEESAQSPFQR